MDGRGRPRPTALVCGEPTATTRRMACELAASGHDVHLRAGTLHEDDGWLALRLHPAPSDERALLAAAAGRAHAPAVVVLAEGSDPQVAAAARTLVAHSAEPSRVVHLAEPRPTGSTRTRRRGYRLPAVTGLVTRLLTAAAARTRGSSRG